MKSRHTTYSINLFREHVLPERPRKALFLAMMAYLLICGAALAFSAFQSAKHIAAASLQMHELKAVEKQVMVGKKGPGDVISYAEKIQPQLAANAEILGGIERNLKKNINFVAVLLGIVNPLPENCLLLDINLQLDKQMLRFSIMTPAGGLNEYTAGTLIKRWNKAGILQKYIGEIQTEASRRDFRAGRTVIIHRFKATIGHPE